MTSASVQRFDIESQVRGALSRVIERCPFVLAVVAADSRGLLIDSVGQESAQRDPATLAAMCSAADSTADMIFGYMQLDAPEMVEIGSKEWKVLTRRSDTQKFTLLALARVSAPSSEIDAALREAIADLEGIFRRMFESP